MQPSAPRETAPPEGPCPSAEELAAYIDGVLGPEEAARVTEHLADCEDCFEVYSESVRFLLDPPEPDSGKTENVVPFVPPAHSAPPAPLPARRGGARKWYPVAAVLAVGVGAGTYIHLLAPPPELTPAQVAASLPSQPALLSGFWEGRTTRGSGGNEDAAEPIEEAPFRMGVQLLNLEVALKAGNGGVAQNVIARIYGLLDGQLFSDELKKDYTEITAALNDPKKKTREFLPEASRLAAQTREMFLGDEASLDFGQWVETGYLAALVRNPAFFQQGENLSFLRRFLWRERLGLGETRLDPKARESLGEIAKTVSKGDLTDADYEDLRKRFEEILEIYYPET